MPGKSLIDTILEITKHSHSIEPGEYLSFDDQESETLYIPLEIIVNVEPSTNSEDETFTITTSGGEGYQKIYENVSTVMVVTVH